jgi:AmiR/NasT family two-component response regulator
LQPGLKVFLVTAYSKAEIVKAAKECRIARIFHKPLDLEELLAKLAALSSSWLSRDEEMFALA